jgi:exopolysaccharide biosynthesis operon protein EpsL
MRATRITALAALLFAPAASYAYLTTDDIIWTETGRYPGYTAPAIPGRTIRFSVDGGVHRDNNLFRLSDAANAPALIGSTERSDTITRVGLGLRAEIPVSLQRFIIDAHVDDFKYDRFSLLNNVSHRVNAAWQWQIGSRWRGDLGYDQSRFLAGFGELQTIVRDVIDDKRGYASAGYLLTPRWRIHGALDAREFKHSDPTRQNLNLSSDTVMIGVDYFTPLNNTIGLQYSTTKGDVANPLVVGALLVNNDYKENSLSGVVHYVVTGRSTLDARLGYTKREHEQFPQRDFKGATARLGYDWTVTGRVLLNFQAWRETQGYGFTTTALQNLQDTSASYVVATGFSVGPHWAFSEKVVLQARYTDEKRDYKGDPGTALIGATSRNDTFRGLALAAGYTPIRNLQLSLGFETGKRTSNVALRDYDYTAVSATGRFTF